MKDGDVNTAFFYQHARYRKKKIFITIFLVEDNIIVDHGDKKEAASDFFDCALGMADVRDYTFDLSAFHSPHLDPSHFEERFSLDALLVKDYRPSYIVLSNW